MTDSSKREAVFLLFVVNSALLMILVLLLVVMLTCTKLEQGEEQGASNKLNLLAKATTGPQLKVPSKHATSQTFR